ncbi:MAG: PTS sugar transporter subunit IIB [Anaerolineaceae bacterium]|jgi:PTS system galactitol-specific IIB component|nr:PTS sugar transporter subunit IIB [Anaerolineaceae bacterium]NTV35532.1 PTS sugar transporter subunit IIB [Anaerolineaceae bacterium]
MKKTILVSCGTAIATSTVVAIGVKEELEERGIDVNVRQCKTAEISAHLEGVDLIVTTTTVTGDFGVPIIRTLAFLTGIGKKAAVDEIVAALNL